MILVLLAVFNSCERNIDIYPFVGVWAGISGEQYVEVEITEDAMYSHTLSQGNRQPIKFSVVDDSLIYETFNMTVGYQLIADSILILSNIDFSDTLYCLEGSQSILEINDLDLNDTVEFQKFRDEYYKRAISFYNQLGYENHWDFLEDRYGPFEGEEEIIYE